MMMTMMMMVVMKYGPCGSGRTRVGKTHDFFIKNRKTSDFFFDLNQIFFI